MLVKSFFLIFVPALAVIALGVAAMMAGEADDSPGLGGIGMLLIVGSLAAAVWKAQRSP